MNSSSKVNAPFTYKKFQVTKSQSLLALIALLLLISLAISSILESRTTEKQSAVLSNIESPAASIIFTQRETLVYTTKLALWSNGGTTRREVQIARSLLAQRLSVIDSSGRDMGSRANHAYWTALTKADSIVAAAPMGYLPEPMHPEMNKVLVPVIEDIVSQARELVVSYQKSVDQEMLDLARQRAQWDWLNLILLYLFIAVAALFLSLNMRSNFKNYRLAQQAIKAEREKLEETISTLNATQNTVAQLQDLNAAKSALISNVNHELRTPLTSIIGYIELVQREATIKADPLLQKYLEVIERNSQMLLKLVESLLSLSKFDSGGGVLKKEEVQLDKVVSDAIFVLHPAAQKSGVDIVARDFPRVWVFGDDSQLSQVFINLISNAVKFGKIGAQVEIDFKVDQQANKVLVTITDYGIGIPLEDQAQLFTRFFRASNVTGALFDGAGLGLSIVQQVLTNHGGSIAVQSKVGSGSTFTVTLPLLAEVAPRE